MQKEHFNSWTVIAGPCSAESREGITTSARRLKELGVDIFRAGVWKPRTSPKSWQGCGDEAIDWMKEARQETGIAIATEVKDVRTTEVALNADFDVLWIGSRNSQCYQLLEEVGKLTSQNKRTIILKRGMSSSLDEWLGSADYVIKHNDNVVLCERGIRGYSPDTRNILDLQTARLAQDKAGLPVIVDVSHASGRRDLVPFMAMAVKAAGLSGIMIESHPTPDKAITDGFQQISLEDFGTVMRRLNLIPDKEILYG